MSEWNTLVSMGKKLLVADDSVTIQKVIKLALSSEGYDILAVSDGREAIRAIQEERPDVVLIDVGLPLADAYAVKKAINADPQLSSTGFILLASAFERVDERAVDEAGFHDRLIKPFDPSHLRKAVADVMGKAKSAPARVSPPQPPREFDSGDDLPPVQDMHPTVHDEPERLVVTEEELNIETPEPTGFIVAPTVSTTMSPPPPPAFVPPAFSEEVEEVAATRALENDIKDLTESTIKLSGLDEYQWNLDDSKKMRTTTVSSDHTREISRSAHKDATIKNIITIPPKPIDDGGSNFPLKHASASAAPPPPAAPHHFTAPSPSSGNVTMSRAEIEELVKKDVQAALEKIMRDVVPQIAENVIRKEIEKILAEP